MPRASPGCMRPGEVTGGLHGANRLGGNSLVETLVFGRRAGEAAAAYSPGRQVQLRTKRAIDDAHAELDRLTREGDELAPPAPAARCAITCGRTAAWCVTRTGCGWASKGSPGLAGQPSRCDVRPSSEGYKDLALALDLRGSLVAAEATLRCALEPP